MSGDTACRLGRLFGLDVTVWMNLQAQYDLEVAERGLRKRLDTEVTPLRAVL